MKSRTHMFLAWLVCVCGSLMSFSSRAQTAADSYWWHYGLSQSQRNANILTRAQTFPDNTYVGVSCKVWVQSMVVPQASHWVASIPLNNPYYCWMWQWGPDIVTLATDRWDGIPWPPGSIIQAQVNAASGGTLPHTMIVQWASPYGASVIECNWQGDGKVRRRYASWAVLRAQIVHYTLYEVK